MSRGWSSSSPNILGKKSGRRRPRKRFASVTVRGPPFLAISHLSREYENRYLVVGVEPMKRYRRKGNWLGNREGVVKGSDESYR
jgi:hypothetical protein